MAQRNREDPQRPRVFLHVAMFPNLKGTFVGMIATLVYTMIKAFENVHEGTCTGDP